MLAEADVDSDGRTTFASLPPGWVKPVAGVLTSRWASLFDAMFLSSPDLRADPIGRVRFEQLPSWPAVRHA